MDNSRIRSVSANIPRIVLNAMLNQDHLNICHINVQSICARNFSKFYELKSVLLNSKLDIICMTESWLSDKITDQMIAIEGYKIIRNDRNRHGGGICVYYRDTLSCRIVNKSIYDADYGRQITEFLLLDFRHANENFLLAVYYNPPNLNCADILKSHFENFSVKYNSTYFIGDFNTNLLYNSYRLQHLREVVSNFCYSFINSEPTYFYSSGCSLLDLFITDSPHMVLKNDQISLPGVSHHDMIIFSLNYSLSKTSDSTVQFRNYERINFAELQNAFYDFAWGDFYSIDNPNVLLDFFMRNLTYLHDRFVPLKSMRIKHENCWFNSDIERAMLNRDLAYRTWKSSKLDSDKVNYKILRNRTNFLIRKAKSTHDRKKFNTNLPSKQLWNNVKKLGLKDDNRCSNSIDISSEQINDFFVSNFTMDDSTIPTFAACPNGFTFKPFLDYEIINSVFSIKSNAFGLDGVPIKFIQIMLPLILPLIKHLFHSIIKTSIYPQGWKTVKVIPIKKKGNSSAIANLRPISILSALSKVFEKLINTQISSFINDLNLLHPYQSGFRKNHSTETALLKVHDDIALTLDKKGIAILLLIDFAKAFDRVSHRKLVNKLRSDFLFSESAAKLIESYLIHRSQAVFCNGILSTFQNIGSGVPQGSILGPLLFSLFINNLPLVLEHCSIHLFADDVQIYFCSDSVFDLSVIRNKINKDLSNIYKWSQHNLLPINQSKTKAIIFSKLRSSIVCPALLFGNEQVEFVNRVNNLGVIFTSDLDWDAHINSQCGKIFGVLKRLNLVTRHFDSATKTRLFKSLIFPHFIYGDFVYTNASAAAINKLRIALNACIRYVYNLSRYSRVTHLQKSLIGCPFAQFYRFRSCCTIQKIIFTKKPNYLLSKLRPFRQTRTLNYLLPHFNSSYYSQSMFARGIVFWNSLPVSTKSCTTIVSFKQSLLEELNRLD